MRLPCHHYENILNNLFDNGDKSVVSNPEENLILSSGSINVKKFINAGFTTTMVPQIIVLHHTGISFKETKEKFGGKVAAHYVVDKDGTIYQFVEDNKAANHVKLRNNEAIGIEIVNSGNINENYAVQQYASITLLLTYLTKKHNIPYDDGHILAHYQVEPGRYDDTKRKWDPSPNFNWAQIDLPLHPEFKSTISSQTCISEVDFESTGYSCDLIYK